jgi:methionine synthase I (cobalamin-dependent)/5,10-methylenetetrahydrofolate reductase
MMTLQKQLATHSVLLVDGAMGTELLARGATLEQSLDGLNLSQPNWVQDVHERYLQAGAQVLETNTFGANEYQLAQFGLQEQLVAINQAGVKLARQAIAHTQLAAQVLGSVGPLGVRLAPYGRISSEQAKAAFMLQIEALVKAGVDGLILETFSDLSELQVALAAAQAVLFAQQLSDLPIIACLSFAKDDRTLMGDEPAQAAQALATAGASVIGVNCSIGPAQVLRIIKRMAAVHPTLRYAALPNAGWPEQRGGRTHYPATPAYFGSYAAQFQKAGAVLIGGCCGTTPEHIRALCDGLQAAAVTRADLANAVAPVEATIATPPSQLDQTREARLLHAFTTDRFVTTVEVSPPKGCDLSKTLARVQLLADAGASMVNIADNPLARMRMSPWAVCHAVQQQIGLDTVLHFPTRGRNLLRVQGDLLASHALGIHNVFATMGDRTAIGDYPQAMDQYDVVPTGLIKLIKHNLNRGLDSAEQTIGTATRFVVGCALSLTPNELDKEIELLRKKIASGADFALTQPAFDLDGVAAFFRRYQELHGELTLPLLVGVLPLYNSRHATFLHNEVPGMSIPAAYQAQMAASSDADAPKVGTEIAKELIATLRQYKAVKGIYIMPPFSKFEIATELIRSCQA